MWPMRSMLGPSASGYLNRRSTTKSAGWYMCLTRLSTGSSAVSRSSDASHELKTPLTIMRGEIESALRSEVDGLQIESLLDDCWNRRNGFQTSSRNCYY